MTDRTRSVIESADLWATVVAIIVAAVLTFVALRVLRKLRQKVTQTIVFVPIVILTFLVLYVLTIIAASSAFDIVYRPYLKEAILHAEGNEFIGEKYGFVPLWISPGSTSKVAAISIFIVVSTMFLVATNLKKKNMVK